MTLRVVFILMYLNCVEEHAADELQSVSHLVSGPQVLVFLLALTQGLPLSIQSLDKMSVLQTLQRKLLGQNLELPLEGFQLLALQTQTQIFNTERTSDQQNKTTRVLDHLSCSAIS